MTARILKRFNREQLTLGAAGGLAGLLLLTGLGGGEPAGATFRLPSAERAYASAPSTAPEYVHEKFSVYWDGRDIFMPVAVDKLPVPDLTPPMPRLEPLALPPLGPGPAFEALNRLTHGTISVGAADLPSDAELAELVNLAEPEPAAPADRRAEKMREWDVIHRTGNLAPLEGRIVHEAPGYVDFQGKDKARMRIPWSQVSFDKKTGEPWIERGWTYEEEYRHRSGRLKGGDASGRIALAEWSREYGMTTEAAQEYRAAVEILKARGDFKKEFFDIVGAAGDLMCETGDFDGAVALYAAVMQWTPFERAEMAVRTGDAMRALGLNEAALDAYGQALEASPRTTRARASQARLLYQSGRDAEA
ncbi:MAG: hypothetical protein HYY16_06575, partial [Planctomycetes bacterium]|nr:hypothetical protein [Planctomycetota bacterium]